MKTTQKVHFKPVYFRRMHSIFWGDIFRVRGYGLGHEACFLNILLKIRRGLYRTSNSLKHSG